MTTAATEPTIRPGRYLGRPLVGQAYLSTAAFAKAIGVSARAVVAMAESGRLDFCRHGKWRLLIPETELERPELAERRVSDATLTTTAV